jgi:hypothetical protein
MASYLSYFTSGGSSNQPSQYGNQNVAPAGPTSTWSSTFSSRIATLRKALTKDSEEDDPDYEDSSHVSNVLRAYYTEKGRTFPEWLPQDPKKPAPAPMPQQNTYSQYGGGYGSQYGAQPDYSRNSGSQGGLSDLWDSGPAAPAPAPVQSLRAPRPTPQSLRSQDGAMSQQQSSGPSYAQQSSAARPLPSQRAGSFQNTSSAGAAAGAMGSRDRLRARLQGGGSGRSSPAPQGQQSSYSGSTNSYDSGGGSPYVSASEPWSSGSSNPYHDPGPTGTYNAAPRQRPGGLPSGPRGPR